MGGEKVDPAIDTSDPEESMTAPWIQIFIEPAARAAPYLHFIQVRDKTGGPAAVDVALHCIVQLVKQLIDEAYSSASAASLKIL